MHSQRFSPLIQLCVSCVRARDCPPTRRSSGAFEKRLGRLLRIRSKQLCEALSAQSRLPQWTPAWHSPCQGPLALLPADSEPPGSKSKVKCRYQAKTRHLADSVPLACKKEETFYLLGPSPLRISRVWGARETVAIGSCR